MDEGVASARFTLGRKEMFDKLEKLVERYHQVNKLLSDPNIINDQTKYRNLIKEHNELRGIVERYGQYKKLIQTLQEDMAILEKSEDRELQEMAKEEIAELQSERERLENELKTLLIPKDPQDSKNVIMEIRAGTGGEEAGLFARDLYRMYTRFAERQGWKVEPLSSHPTEMGGFKEIIFSISGKDVYGKLKYESGVHRVQRVPITEASGRIHTSAASVVVLPEAEEVDVEIKPEELRIDVFRSSGPGGQSVNTADSAVRITHFPTGIVVTCQDERSQHKNKIKAMKVLRARLLARKQQEENAKLAHLRKSQIRSGDRSEKIRTFNFPQNRVTDHRIGLTLYKLEEILDGELEEIIEQLKLADRAEKLKEL